LFQLKITIIANELTFNRLSVASIFQLVIHIINGTVFDSIWKRDQGNLQQIISNGTNLSKNLPIMIPKLFE